MNETMEFNEHELSYLFTSVTTCYIVAIEAFKKLVLNAEIEGELTFELIEELEDLTHTVSFGVVLLEKYKTCLPESRKDEIDATEFIDDARIMKSWIENIREKLEQK